MCAWRLRSAASDVAASVSPEQFHSSSAAATSGAACRAASAPGWELLLAIERRLSPMANEAVGAAPAGGGGSTALSRWSATRPTATR